LPEQEIAYSLLSSSSNEQIRLWGIVKLEMGRQILFRESGYEVGLRLQHTPHSLH
jgi:hypothetical protein